MKFKDNKIIIFIVIFFLAVQIAISLHLRNVYAGWANVPPAPANSKVASFATLGDDAFAYRSLGLIFQNLGSVGADVQPLVNYDYSRLGKWFFIMDELDSKSHYIPFLAAYFFGATPDSKQLDPLIDYLRYAGREREMSAGTESWRWLAQAIYLARFQQEDYEKASIMAEELASMWKPGMPGWAKQMPAFIALQQGNKQAARELMLAIIQQEGEKMDPNEVNFMLAYICERTLSPDEAAKDPLCELVK